MPILSNIVQGRQVDRQTEIAAAIDSAARNLATHLLSSFPDVYEQLFRVIIHRFELLSPTQIVKVAIRTAELAYGVPRSQVLKHYAIPYYNPTEQTFSLAWLGLDQKRIGPKESVLVPLPYTLGGKASAVLSTAPKLVPIPVQVEKLSHDYTPLTFDEWVTYCSYKDSPCGGVVVWCTTQRKRVCAKSFTGTCQCSTQI